MEYCGTESTVQFVPELFPESCRLHDECYRNISMTQHNCDWLFLQNMYYEAPVYLLLIPVYFLGVVLLGGKAYKNAQRKKIIEYKIS